MFIQNANVRCVRASTLMSSWCCRRGLVAAFDFNLQKEKNDITYKLATKIETKETTILEKKDYNSAKKAPRLNENR